MIFEYIDFAEAMTSIFEIYWKRSMTIKENLKYNKREIIFRKI
jgi:hypothetical protein